MMTNSEHDALWKNGAKNIGTLHSDLTQIRDSLHVMAALEILRQKHEAELLDDEEVRKDRIDDLKSLSNIIGFTIN